jgi:D-alanyl-D-alanine carboxypeptidase (penicillin-binding protein 5/6)
MPDPEDQHFPGAVGRSASVPGKGRTPQRRSALRLGSRRPLAYFRCVRLRRVAGAAAAAFVIAAVGGPALAAPTYPPVAPTPTDSGNSPMAPDPHPPLGGVAPNGALVGGARLENRGLIVPAHVPALPRSLTAQAWILVDLDSGNILAAKDPHGRYQPASILKLLTTVTLLPLLPGKRTVRVSNAAAETEGSHAGLVANGTYTIDELFSGLLLVSGNDAAAALADAAGGYRHTVDLMNQEARALGAYDTVVQTPSGLDGWQQLTSAYDMAIFLRAAVGQPRFVAYDRAATATLPWQSVNGYGPVTLANQNETFLTTVPGALVAKTGYTDAAQHTFAGAMQRGGRRLGVVFLRAQRYPTDQWQQAVDLLNWGFRLPAATAAVGRLEAPVPTPTVSATLAPKREATSAVAAVFGGGHGGDGPGSWVYVLAGIVALAALAPFAWPRRPHPRRAGTRSATATSRRRPG